MVEGYDERRSDARTGVAVIFPVIENLNRYTELEWQAFFGEIFARSGNVFAIAGRGNHRCR